MNYQYVPYLRSKQSELLALREFAQYCPNLIPYIFPVIEPVKKDSAALERATDIMLENGMRFAIILNPRNGYFESNREAFFDSLSSKLKMCVGEKWIPAYVCKEEEFLETSSLLRPNAMLVFQGKIGYSDKVQSLIDNSKTLWILDGTEKSRSFSKRLLAAQDKKVLRLEDNFQEQQRNSDYAHVPDELFSESPWYFKEDGYCGVSDYTVLPQAFRDGGMLPYAVAIHITYQNQNWINVHHFVSDSNRDQSDVQGKFREAAKKVSEFFCSSSTRMTRGVSDLLSSYERGQYPGLGALKKWSILNHLELMCQVMKGLPSESSI